MKNRRQERFEELIRRNVSEVLTSVIDEFLNYFITITYVDISADLMNVEIGYSVFGENGEKEKVAELLKELRSRIRFELGNRIAFRRVPVFYFKYDNTIEKAARIENILLKLKE